MNDEFKNLKSWGSTIDSFIGGVTAIAGSVTGLVIMAFIPILCIWGVLWLLVEMGIL